MAEGSDNLRASMNVKKVYIAVLLATGALYTATCAPGALWQDSGMYQYRIWHGDIEGNLGLALSHPLYHIVGMGIKHIPIGEFGYRVNLISTLCAAVSVANVYLLLRLWLGKTLPALVGAITLALSHTMWQHAAIAEVYTSYTALFTLELIFLLQYFRTKRIGYLYLSGFLNGLAIATHMWAVIPFACYIVFLIVLLARKQIRFLHVAGIAGLWIMGALPYEYLIIKNIAQTGELAGTLGSALFGNAWRGEVLNARVPLRLIKENLMFLAYNFPTPNALFFFVGLYGYKKLSPARSFKGIILALLVLFFVFAFRYTVPDRYAFFLPFYVLACVFVGAGFYLFAERSGHRTRAIVVLVFAFLPVVVFYFAPIAAERMEMDPGSKRTIPYRNDYAWFLRPWQRWNRGPELFAEAALASVEKDAILIADSTTVYALWYVQNFKGESADVQVISQNLNYRNAIMFPTADTIVDLMEKHAVYVVSDVAGYCPRYLLEGYGFESAGAVRRVVDKQTR